MADISEWSPVDESNTAAPPNGWPEGQATNTVNNCARAMMGATRRWYDTVTAQLASLTSSLAGYLHLSGGTMTGNLSAPGYLLSGAAFAHRDAVNNFHTVYDADGVTPALLLGGGAAGHNNYYRAEGHVFQTDNGAATFATLGFTGLTVTGNIVATHITASGNLSGNVVTGDLVQSNGNIAAAGDIGAGNDIGATGDIVAGNGSSGGNITSRYPGQFVGNACNIGTGTFTNLDASDIDCAGNIDAAAYTRGGVPMVMLSQQQLDRIEARIAALEQQKVAA